MAATEESETPTFKVSIDAEAIERKVTDAILQSALGNRIEKAVEAALSGKGRGFSMSDPITDAVTAEVHKAMMNVVRTEYAEAIREKVRAALTDDELDKLVTTLVVNLTVLRDAR